MPPVPTKGEFLIAGPRLSSRREWLMEVGQMNAMPSHRSGVIQGVKDAIHNITHPGDNHGNTGHSA
jgi:hypothetical protein